MGASSKSSGGYAAMLPTEQARAGSMLNMVASAAPITETTNVDKLSELMNTMDMLRRYTSRAQERELSPDVAAARAAEEKMLGDEAQMAATGKLSPAIQRMLATNVLVNATQGSLPVSDGSFAKKNLAALYGRGAVGLQQSLADRTRAGLAQHQAPAGGLSAESAAQITMSDRAKNAAARNNWIQQLLGTAGQQQAGLSQYGMGAMNAAVSEDMANKAAQNAMWGQIIGGALGMGSKLGAAAMV